jgi:hypothetical protein
MARALDSAVRVQAAAVPAAVPAVLPPSRQEYLRSLQKRLCCCYQ